MQRGIVHVSPVELDPIFSKTCVTIGAAARNDGSFYLVLDGCILKMSRVSRQVYSHETINVSNWASTRTVFSCDGFLFAVTATNLYRVLGPEDTS